MGQESGNGFAESSNSDSSHSAIKCQLWPHSSLGSPEGEATSRLTHVVVGKVQFPSCC